MSPLSDRLDDYAALPPDDRAALDREAAASPADAALLADARRFADLLDAAARVGGTVSPDDLAAYLTDRALGLVPDDADRIAAALAADPGLRAEADAMQAHLDVLGAAEDPLAQFERLSGQRLAGPLDAAPDAATPAAETPAAETSAASRREPARLVGRSPDRAAATPPRKRLVSARRVLVAAAFVVLAYGGLFAASAVTSGPQTERERVADLPDLASYAAPTLRGTPGDPLAARLDAALDAVAGARRTTLGLFPRTDGAALDAASNDLAALIAEANAGSTVSQEARLALARVRLHQSRDDEAVRLLGGLVQEQSYRATEARRLLDFIRTQ